MRTHVITIYLWKLIIVEAGHIDITSANLAFASPRSDSALLAVTLSSLLFFARMLFSSCTKPETCKCLQQLVTGKHLKWFRDPFGTQKPSNTAHAAL